MSVFEVLRSSVRGITANWLRSVLTLLGVLIGVAAVITLTAVGQGSANTITESISSLGANTLTVTSSAANRGSSTTSAALTMDVVDALADPEASSDIAAVVPEVSSSQTVTAGDASSTSTVLGTTVEYFEVTGSDVAQGTAFSQSDHDASRRVAVIGADLAETLFSGEDAVGQTITVGTTPFTVIGVLQAQDTVGGSSTNSAVIAPLTRVQDSFTGYGSLSTVVLQATSADTVDGAQADATLVLDSLLGTDTSGNAAYTISDQAELLETQAETADTFTTLLAAVAGISLLVGGIGVTNIMLVTVTERTREIGIRKALGATRWAVLGQFLAEATALSLLGGLLGVGVALIACSFDISGVDPVIDPATVVLALAVSVAIGVFFGGFPAHRAAGLRPVLALRHE
ncbi:ABC transporter permease [Modestobacter italicus]|uniref:ABC transporter permease n=1 Tax=Modestobacter italicus (strain DSM 44449 / CECT 9708 / BC 501) TaxID=2732864 RepID=UPI001C98D783|nr:ABC transporter permease [Modestobacter italicus]